MRVSEAKFQREVGQYIDGFPVRHLFHDRWAPWRLDTRSGSRPSGDHRPTGHFNSWPNRPQYTMLGRTKLSQILVIIYRQIFEADCRVKVTNDGLTLVSPPSWHYSSEDHRMQRRLCDFGYYPESITHIFVAHQERMTRIIEECNRLAINACDLFGNNSNPAGIVPERWYCSSNEYYGDRLLQEMCSTMLEFSKAMKNYTKMNCDYDLFRYYSIIKNQRHLCKAEFSDIALFDNRNRRLPAIGMKNDQYIVNGFNSDLLARASRNSIQLMTRVHSVLAFDPRFRKVVQLFHVEIPDPRPLCTRTNKPVQPRQMKLENYVVSFSRRVQLFLNEEKKKLRLQQVRLASHSYDFDRGITVARMVSLYKEALRMEYEETHYQSDYDLYRCIKSLCKSFTTDEICGHPVSRYLAVHEGIVLFSDKVVNGYF